MIIQWTNKKGVLMAGKTVDMHKDQALKEIQAGNAILVQSGITIERQIVQDVIEARKAQNNITVLHVTPEDLKESESEIE